MASDDTRPPTQIPINDLWSDAALLRELRWPKFTSVEHKALGDIAARIAIGDEAAGEVDVKLAADMSVTYGDMVALAGDFFESIAEMRRIAAITGIGPGTREEIRYAQLVKVRNLIDLAGKFSPEVRAAVDRREQQINTSNRSHFLHPTARDLTRPVAERDADLDTETNRPLNAGAGYVLYHHLAMREAYEAGRHNAPISFALACEAFSNHYLTDAFAGGHVRTPRADAQSYWNQRVPDFFERFKALVADRVASEIKNPSKGKEEESAPWFVTMWSESFLRSQSRSALDGMLKRNGIPDFGMGDLVSLALHDLDNHRGVAVTAPDLTEPVVLYGDGELYDENNRLRDDARPTKELAVKAVRLSIEDVLASYEAGRRGGDYATFFHSRIDADRRVATQRLLPSPLPDEQQGHRKSVQWRFDTWQQLLADPGMCEAIVEVGRSKHDELAKIAATMKAPYERRALTRGVIEPLGTDPVAFIREVLSR